MGFCKKNNESLATGWAAPSGCFQEAVKMKEKEKRAEAREFWRIVPRTCPSSALSCNHQECTGPSAIQGHAFPTASKVDRDNVPQSAIVEIPETILQEQTEGLHLHVNEKGVNKAFQRWQNNPPRMTSRMKYLQKSFHWSSVSNHPSHSTLRSSAARCVPGPRGARISRWAPVCQRCD